MNSIKTAFTAIALLLVVTSTTFASNNPNTSLSNSLQTELGEMVQNPELVKHNLEEASIIVQFSIDSLGKVVVLGSQTETPYLMNFIEKKMNGQEVNSRTYIPNTTYTVRFKFESK